LLDSLLQEIVEQAGFGFSSPELHQCQAT